MNLCTPSQTYRVRQVHSSNSLHILKPSLGHIARDDIKVIEEEAGESGALNLPDEAVTAIAKCGSTLELHVPASGFSALPFLEKSLRLYDPRSADDDDGDVAMDEASSSGNGSGTGPVHMRALREQLCADIPVSAVQCEQGWVDICAFVDGKRELSGWRPSARALLNVWKRLVEGALLQGIDLEKQFLVGDLWKSVLDDGDETAEPPFPRGLLEAVARKLCVADERPSLGDDIKCKFLWLRTWQVSLATEADPFTIQGQALTSLDALNGWARPILPPRHQQHLLPLAEVISCGRGKTLCQSRGETRLSYPNYKTTCTRAPIRRLSSSWSRRSDSQAARSHQQPQLPLKQKPKQRGTGTSCSKTRSASDYTLPMRNCVH